MASVGDILLQPEAGWKRIDDRDENISYGMANWSKYSEASAYNGGHTMTRTNGAIFSFRFVGTKFRIVCPKNKDLSNLLHVIVDGKKVGEYSIASSSLIFNILSFEMKNLTLETHTVSIINKTDGIILNDAIDIDDDGYLLEHDKPFPITLTQPEEGWKRYESQENMFNYQGSWIINENATGYSGDSVCESVDIGDSISFSFTGDKLRIISEGGTNLSDNVQIFLDDNMQTISTDKFGVYNNKCALIYEATNLNVDVAHKCILVNNSNKPFKFDAIDIDESGVMLPILSRDYEFPIAVIEESEVDDYAKSLINGEEQLLITPTGKLFLTNGNKGFITVGGEVDLSSYYTKEQIDELIANQNVDLSNYYNKQDIDAMGLATEEFVVNKIKDAGLTITENVAKNQTCFAGSFHSAPYVPENAFDENKITNWLASGTIGPNSWICVQLKEAKKIKFLKLGQTYIGGGIGCNDFELLASNDGTDYKTILTGNLVSGESIQQDYVIPVDEIAYMYWKVVIKTVHAGGASPGLSEMQLHVDVANEEEPVIIHEHTNMPILDKIGESANMLTFNGKVVVNNNEYSFRSLPRAKVITNYSTSKGGKLPWLM